MSTSSAQILVSKYQFPLKRNKGSFKTLVITELRWGKAKMSLEYLVCVSKQGSTQRLIETGQKDTETSMDVLLWVKCETTGV